MNKKEWLILLSCLGLVFIPGILGSVFVTTDTAWYNSIKPSITPSDAVFGPVWTLLYLLIAISLFISWQRAKPSQKRTLVVLFSINLLANALWTLLYFGMQNPLAAFIDIIIINLTTILLIVFLRKVRIAASNLLIPYLAWTSFATLLNYLSL
jgi:tryptophan-rich sensory protein